MFSEESSKRHAVVSVRTPRPHGERSMCIHEPGIALGTSREQGGEALRPGSLAMKPCYTAIGAIRG